MAEMDDGGRRRGVVRWFNGQKGYGFISPDDRSEDLFVHQSSIKSEGFRSLGEGETVEFSVEHSSDGRTKAVDVTGPDGSFVVGDRRGGSGGGGGGGYGGGGGFGGGGYGGEGGGGYGGRGDRYGGGGGRRGGGGYGYNERGGGRNEGGGPGACFSCGEVGHMARDCSQGGRGGGGGGRGRFGGGGGGGNECFVCGEAGHFARECPRNSGN